MWSVCASIFTCSSDSAHIEAMRVVHAEVLLDQRTLIFAFAVDRCKQVLGVDLVLDLLVAVGVNNRNNTQTIT